MEPDRSRVRVIIVTGVSGAGKTTVGTALSQALSWPFYDADDYHSAINIEKMSRGHPLTDDDRAPWLKALCKVISGIVRADERAVLACSALKRKHREALVPSDVPLGAVRFVHLDVPVAVLRARLAGRSHHFFPPALLDSQLAALEHGEDDVSVDGAMPVEAIVSKIREELMV
jgi:gluconokinase